MKVATIVFFFFSFFSNQCLLAQSVENWKKEYDEEGMVIYTRKPEGSNIKSFKSYKVVEGNLHQCVAVFMDWQNHSKWMFHMKKGLLISQPSPMDRYLYYVIGIQWPIKDRDVITRNEYIYNEVENSVTIKLTSFPDMYPRQEDCVRIRIAVGYWKFVQLPNNKVHISYQYQNDPEGLPGWMINLFILDVPRYSLSMVEKKIKEPMYRNAKYDWIK